MLKFAIYLVLTIALVFGERTADYIYNDINAIGACFRRFNASAQIGCNSDRKGNVGVVHYITNDSDLDWFVDTAPHKPYVVLLTPRMFNRDVVDKLTRSKKVNAILLIHTDGSPMPDDFSPDSTCPNNEYDLYSEDSTYKNCRNQTWNAEANSLMFDDHKFPIVTLTKNGEVQDLIRDCYEEHNAPHSDGTARSYPLCAAEVKSAMDGAVDSETCIRRSQMITNLNPQVYCDPMGDYNVFGFVKPGFRSQDESLMNGELIMASARLDSFSMFDNLYPSADSAVTGIVSLLAVAETLGRVKEEFNNRDRPIMLNFYNGEAFEYIGSARTLYEMNKGRYPYKPEKDSDVDDGMHKILPHHIGTYIEMSQLGLQDDGKLWLHTDPLSRQDADINENVATLLEEMMQFAADDNLSVGTAPEVQPLPPASVQTFLKDDTSNFSAVVFADHMAEFTNQYYNSIYDIADIINATYPANMTKNESYYYVTDAAAQLTKVATVIARTLYKQSRGIEPPENVTADETVVANLLYCFLHDPQDCELIKYILDEDDAKRFEKSDPQAFSYYVGVQPTYSTTGNWVPHIVQNILAFYVGDRVDKDEEECEKKNKNDYLHKYIWMQGWVKDNGERKGICTKATVNFTLARSPVFDDIDNYDWGSNEYSTWTESRWATDAISVRFFLVPPLALEVSTLVIGIVMILITWPIVYLISKRGYNLFEPSARYV